MSQTVLVITGPTASGKSDIALRIAQEKNGVIINADSKQVYKEIPIITAQPDNICDDMFYLYGYISIKSYYSVRLWLQDVSIAIQNAWNNNKLPIVVGGSGMYISALANGFQCIKNFDHGIRNDLELKMKKLGKEGFYNMLVAQGIEIGSIHCHDSYRLIRAAEDYLHQRKVRECKKISDNIIVYVLIPERQVIYDRINQRFIKMIEGGAMQEISYLGSNLEEYMPAMKSFGVIEMLQYVQHKVSLSTAIADAQRSTRRYAKRQITWCRNQFTNAIFKECGDSLLNSCLSNEKI